MFKILLLLSIIQHVTSSNIPQQAIASRNQIGMTNAKVELVDCTSLKVTFNIKNDIDQLTGLFSVHHSACPVSAKTICGFTNVGSFDKDQDQGRKITVQLDSKYISPCKSYSDFKIRAYENDGRIKSRSIDWEAKSLGHCCDQLTTTPTTTIPQNSSTADMHKNSSSTTVIIVPVVVVFFIGDNITRGSIVIDSVESIFFSLDHFISVLLFFSLLPPLEENDNKGSTDQNNQHDGYNDHSGG